MAKDRTRLREVDAFALITRVVGMLGALSPSADLVLHFTPDEQISSHSDPECVYLVPRYFQARQSSLPVV
jgi:hypothetical protein